MGTFQMGVLLPFNSGDSLTFQELLDHSQMPDKELLKQIQAIMDSKLIVTEVSRPGGTRGGR